MKYGVGLPLSVDSLDSVVEYAREAERLGFHSVAAADHVSIRYEALTALTAIASRTERIKIATLVLDGNRRSPALLAHATATLDRLSGGRLILGVGKGVFNEASYGLSFKKPVSRMLEAVEALKRLWTEEEVSYKGQFFEYEGLRLNSKPLQKPHPPLWIAAFGRRMHRIAAEVADGFVTQNMPPTLFERCLERVKEDACNAGRDPEDLEAVYGMMPVSVASDRVTARRMIEPSAKSFLLRHSRRIGRAMGYRVPWTKLKEIPEEAVDECYAFGTPEECAERVEEYVKAGATYIIFQSLIPQGIKTLRSLAEEIYGE